MHRLDIAIEEFEIESWPNGKINATAFRIDGERITEWIGGFYPDLCQAGRKSSPRGRWIGVSVVTTQPLALDFLGAPRREFIDDCGGRSPIAACSDCEMGCRCGAARRLHLGRVLGTPRE